jgi:hypothetical protein
MLMNKFSVVRRSFSVINIALVGVLFLALLLAPAKASARDSDWYGNVHVYGGVTDLNDAWKFSTTDAATGEYLDLDLTNPFQFGLQFDINRRESTGDRWSISPFVGIYFTSASESDKGSNSNGTTTVTATVDLDMTEIDLGFMNYFTPESYDLTPFFGGGLAIIDIDYSKNITSVKVGETPIVNKEAEAGRLYGMWLATGLVFRPIQSLSFGLDLRYVYTRKGLSMGNRINAWNVGAKAGWHF